jgi:hypothetical protein
VTENKENEEVKVKLRIVFDLNLNFSGKREIEPESRKARAALTRI